MTLHLVRDLLDAQLVDRHGRAIGSVDTIVLEPHRGRPPTVIAIEVGAPAVLRRLHPALARWSRRLPLTRLPLTSLRRVGPDLQADVDAARHPTLLRIEKWLCRHIVERLPWSGA